MRLIIFLSVAFGCLQSSIAVSQETDSVAATQVRELPAAPKTDEHKAARKTATACDASMIVDGKLVALTLKSDPLLSYQTVIRRWSKGSAWVWGDQGRPQAMLSLVTLNGNRTRYYEFLSFSTHEILLKEPNGPTWTPTPAWEPKTIAKTKLPADSRRLRLVQMRSIARRFSAFQRDFFEDRKGVRYEMRLLPQPILRYPDDSSESLDGGFFAFVRNGDLELLLVIEAQKGTPGKPPRWVYAAYPVTVHELNLLLDKQPVWHLRNKSIGEVRNPTDKYFLFSRPATDAEISGVL